MRKQLRAKRVSFPRVSRAVLLLCALAVSCGIVQAEGRIAPVENGVPLEERLKWIIVWPKESEMIRQTNGVVEVV